MKHVPALLTRCLATARRLLAPSRPPAVPPAPRRSLRRALREFLGFLRFGVAFAAAPAFGQAREVYVFGDSAVDMGNSNALPGQTPGPHAPYYTGADGFARLSNGPMWPELLYPGLALSSDAHRTGSRVNFAFGAAKTDADSFGLGDELPVGVQSQLAAFAAEVAAGKLAVTARTYAFVEAGPNDYFEAIATGGDLAATGARVAANLGGAAETLAGLGVKTVFVHDLPDFGFAPLFYNLPGVPANEAEALRRGLQTVAQEGRAQLRTALLAARARTGANFVTLPINALFTALRANPAAFGFANLNGRIYDEENDALLVGGAAEQAKYLFVDSLHLAAPAQRWESRYYRNVIDAVEGVPQQRYARVADAALAAGSAWRRIADADRAAGASRWQPFLHTASDWDRGHAGAGQPGWKADSTSAAAGVRFAADERWLAGAAAGGFRQDGEVDGRALRFDLRGGGARLFAAWTTPAFAVRGSAGFAALDCRLKRDPDIPTMLARATPGGRLWDANLEAARTLRAGAWSADLAAGFTHTRFALDAFDESGAPGLNLGVAPVRRESDLAYAAIRLAAPQIELGRVRLEPTAAIEAGGEFGDRRTGVTARLLDNTADPATGFATNGSRWRGTVRAGLGVVLTPRDRLDLEQSFSRGGDGLAQQNLQIAFRHAF